MAKSLKTETTPTSPKTDTAKFYELGYLLVPSIGDEKAGSEVETLTKLFTDRGGELISHEGPVSIELAYPMVKVIHAHREKCSSAYFGWMKFEIETDTIKDITKALDESETLLRYLLVKTVRENTLIKGSMQIGRDERVRKGKVLEEGGEEVEAINEEELDKEIEDLVIA